MLLLQHEQKFVFFFFCLQFLYIDAISPLAVRGAGVSPHYPFPLPPFSFPSTVTHVTVVLGFLA